MKLGIQKEHKMTNKIKKRYYFAFVIETVSPLNVSNGLDVNTDSDVFRNGNNEVVITGTSLAGAFRNYLDDNNTNESIFGFSNNGNGKMSSYFISDLCLKDPKVSIRNNVSLNDDKTVDNKFDSEFVEPGAKGELFINFIVRDNDSKIHDEKYFVEIINKIISGINNGYIRFGKKKSRGFGQIRINEAYSKVFDDSKLADYIAFKPNYKDIKQYTDDKYEFPNIDNDDKFIKMSANFEIPGGLIIREYSAEKGKADYTNIKCNNKPIVSGTSFAGSIRSSAKRILKDLKYKEGESFLDNWFGYADSNNAKQSDILISESVINGGKDILRVRVAIDRFTGGSVAGALYNEEVHYNGNVTLNISIRKKGNYKAMLGLLSLVIDDISKGYATIGGESDIGYGILKLNGEVECSEDLKECRKQLAILLNGEAK